MNRTLFIRADASPTMGTGHVMRCLALAMAARNAGQSVCLAGRIEVPWVRSRLEAEGIRFKSISGTIPKLEQPSLLLEQIEEAGNWVVLDGYHFGLDCQRAVMDSGRKLLVIDDYAHLPEYCCNILLNQNISAERHHYYGEIGETLLGLDYTLLRPEFAEFRNKICKRVFPEPVENILLSLGGGDFLYALAEIVSVISMPHFSGCTFSIIAGKMDLARIRDIFNSYSIPFAILQNVKNMPKLMSQADICITAGGSTCWELCCLGVPFLTVELADNQHALIEELAIRGLAHQFNIATLLGLFTSSELRHSTSLRLCNLVDGYGATKVLRHMRRA